MSNLCFAQMWTNVTNFIFRPHLSHIYLISNLFFHPVMNGLIDEPFNLEGECNKQWNVKIGLYKDTVNNNAIYHASPSVFMKIIADCRVTGWL